MWPRTNFTTPLMPAPLPGPGFCTMTMEQRSTQAPTRSHYDAAFANNSEKVPVEVNWTGGNTGDVQRGHWRFASKSFTPNASLEPVDLWDVSSDELDANLNFINAVQVTTRREATPILAYFARIFGIENFQRTANAVAYIGFAGTLTPEDVDQPIAICMDIFYRMESIAAISDE